MPAGLLFPLQLSQQRLDLRSMQGGSKKARAGGGSGGGNSALNAGAAKALRQNNLPISMYFSKKQ